MVHKTICLLFDSRTGITFNVCLQTIGVNSVYLPRHSSVEEDPPIIRD